MSIIGNSWKEEPSNEEKYNEITGREYSGLSDEQVAARIEKDLQNDLWLSKHERNRLGDLLEQINNKS